MSLQLNAPPERNPALLSGGAESVEGVSLLALDLQQALSRTSNGAPIKVACISERRQQHYGRRA